MINKPKIIKITSFLGTKQCVQEDDAQELFEEIEQNLLDMRHVQVSFDGVEMMPSYFMNTAFGQLYSVFTIEYLQFFLSISDINLNTHATLSVVCQNAVKKERTKNEQP